MNKLLLVTFSLSLTVWAQAPAAPPPPPANPDAVIATIKGKPFTAGELYMLLNASPPQARQNYLANPKAFLQQLGMMQELAAEAEKAHLDKESPFKEALAQLEVQYKMSRMNGLAQAQYGAFANSIPVTTDDQKKYYEANRDKYTQANVKMLFVSFQSSPPAQTDPKAKKVLTESEAKAKIEKLLADLRAGRADFIKMVKEHSDDAESVARDGDFGQPIIATDTAIPSEISKAIFALKPGEISGPVRQKTGFYLFKLESMGTQPFEKVSDDIFMAIRSARVNEWQTKTLNSIEVNIVNPDAFK